jgi:ankyrin repeat protein
MHAHSAIVLFLTAFVTFGGSAWQALAQEKTMLLDTVRAGDLAQVRRIAGKADLEARDPQGRTALLLATHADDFEIARALIEAGSDVNAKDGMKDTPFLYSGAEGHDEILKLILATGKAKLDDTNRYGGIALIPAAHHGHPTTVAILLDAGLDVDHVNNLGWTALLEAVILGDGGPVYQEIVGLLLDAGARQFPDRDGVTPLEHARQRGFDVIAARIAAGAKR